MTIRDYSSWLFFDVFIASLSVYTISFFLEAIKKGIIVGHVNLTMVLLICCVSGALAVIMPPPAVRDNRFILGAWAALCAAVVFLFVLNATDTSITPWRGVFAFIASGTVLACLFLPTDQKV